MNAAIVELKTRARLGLNALRRGELELFERARAVSGMAHAIPSEWRLRQVFTLVSRSVGFSNWDQARRVLGGQAEKGDDMGTFWHAPRCHGLLNHWFAQHAQAQACLRDLPDAVLLPYRRQFVVAGPPYVTELGLARDEPAWAACERDLVAGYASAAWLRLCVQRLAAPATAWVPSQRRAAAAGTQGLSSPPPAPAADAHRLHR